MTLGRVDGLPPLTRGFLDQFVRCWLMQTETGQAIIRAAGDEETAQQTVIRMLNDGLLIIEVDGDQLMLGLTEAGRAAIPGIGQSEEEETHVPQKE